MVSVSIRLFVTGYMDSQTPKCYKNMTHNILTDEQNALDSASNRVIHFLSCFLFRVSPPVYSLLTISTFLEIIKSKIRILGQFSVQFTISSDGDQLKNIKTIQENNYLSFTYCALALYSFFNIKQTSMTVFNEKKDSLQQNRYQKIYNFF